MKKYFVIGLVVFMSTNLSAGSFVQYDLSNYQGYDDNPSFHPASSVQIQDKTVAKIDKPKPAGNYIKILTPTMDKKTGYTKISSLEVDNNK